MEWLKTFHYIQLKWLQIHLSSLYFCFLICIYGSFYYIYLSKDFEKILKDLSLVKTTRMYKSMVEKMVSVVVVFNVTNKWQNEVLL